MLFSLLFYKLNFTLIIKFAIFLHFLTGKTNQKEVLHKFHRLYYLFLVKKLCFSISRMKNDEMWFLVPKNHIHIDRILPRSPEMQKQTNFQGVNSIIVDSSGNKDNIKVYPFNPYINCLRRNSAVQQILHR